MFCCYWYNIHNHNNNVKIRTEPQSNMHETINYKIWMVLVDGAGHLCQPLTASGNIILQQMLILGVFKHVKESGNQA